MRKISPNKMMLASRKGKPLSSGFWKRATFSTFLRSKKNDGSKKRQHRKYFNKADDTGIHIAQRNGKHAMCAECAVNYGFQ